MNVIRTTVGQIPAEGKFFTERTGPRMCTMGRRSAMPSEYLSANLVFADVEGDELASAIRDCCFDVAQTAWQVVSGEGMLLCELEDGAEFEFNEERYTCLERPWCDGLSAMRMDTGQPARVPPYAAVTRPRQSAAQGSSPAQPAPETVFAVEYSFTGAD